MGLCAPKRRNQPGPVSDADAAAPSRLQAGQWGQVWYGAGQDEDMCWAPMTVSIWSFS